MDLGKNNNESVWIHICFDELELNESHSKKLSSKGKVRKMSAQC